MTFLFYIAILALLGFSYLDFKRGEVDNWLIFGLLAAGVAYRLETENITATALGIILMAIVSILMWKFEALGGADCKLLIALVPFIPFVGWPEMLGRLLKFLMWLMLIGGCYAFVWRIAAPRKKKIPFIPAIGLAYLATHFL